MTRWLRKKGLLPAERQSQQAEPDALEQATQTALRLGQLAQVDGRGRAAQAVRAEREGTAASTTAAVPETAGLGRACHVRLALSPPTVIPLATTMSDARG